MNLIPTEEEPIRYDDNCVFYTDRLVMDGDVFLYNNIVYIIFEQVVDKMNGYKLKDDITFKWFSTTNEINYLDIDGNFFLDDAVNFDFKKGILPTFNKKGKIIRSLYEYISRVTFEKRLSLYFNTFKKYGKINMYDLTIHNNGDLYDEGKYEGNIVEKYESGKLLWGDSYGSYSNNVNDPYHFGFIKGSKFFGLVTDEFAIRNTINKDVFDKMIGRLISNGKLI